MCIIPNVYHLRVICGDYCPSIQSKHFPPQKLPELTVTIYIYIYIYIRGKIKSVCFFLETSGLNFKKIQSESMTMQLAFYPSQSRNLILQ